MKLRYCKVVDGHPNRTTPVVLTSFVVRILLAQTPDTMGAEQMGLVANQVQCLTQLRVVIIHQTQQKGEEGHVALVTNQGVLLELINGSVAITILLVRPVQIVEVALDRIQVLGELLHIVSVAESIRDVDQGLGHEPDPSHEVHMELTGMRWLCTGVVI